MYKSDFYQRMKGLNYKVVLPLALASFGVGYLLNQYLPRENDRDGTVPALETTSVEKVIICDLDAYVEESEELQKEMERMQELQKRRFQIFTERE